jgi:hypothetical protein
MRRILLAVRDDREYEDLVASLENPAGTIIRATDLVSAASLLLDSKFDVLVASVDESDCRMLSLLSRLCIPSVFLAKPGFSAIAKPDSLFFFIHFPQEKSLFNSAVQMCLCYSEKMAILDKKQLDLDRMRLIERAKLTLIASKSFSEEQAHRYIEKQSMDRGVSKYIIAQQIVDEAG